MDTRIPRKTRHHDHRLHAVLLPGQRECPARRRSFRFLDQSISATQCLRLWTRSQTPDAFCLQPLGNSTSPDQKELEADYKREMKQHFGIDFNDLYCITNMPIARFASYLKRNHQMKGYMALLRQSFNPATIDGLMCRTTINCSWTGEVFDCDFNQMLKLGMTHPATKKPLHVWDIDPLSYSNIPIKTANHCFGCTAGHGSSCRKHRLISKSPCRVQGDIKGSAYAC